MAGRGGRTAWNSARMGAADRSVVAQMRRAALRLLLNVAALNAAVLSAVALLTSGAGAVARTLSAGAVACAIALWPRLHADRLEEHLSRAPWSPAAAAALGGLVLALSPNVRGTLFPAFLTPVGVCVLFAYWRQALAAAALVIGGYVAGSVAARVHGSAEATLSDVLPALAMIAGGLLPARIAFSTIQGRADAVARWRAAQGGAGRKSGRSGSSRQHDSAILAGVLAGKSDKAMAVELGLGKASWRVRDRRQRLQREHGAGNRRELASLLHRSRSPGGQP
ncbi:MAG: hypothetical protein QOD53_390 [Thermoleophilaceae bacterium]|nr:hypothetical protein [Thermoleophilaceae bacterium]